MKILIIATVLGMAFARPSEDLLQTPLPLVQPAFYPTDSFAPQFHFQDGFGQYSYGYRNELSAKQETKTVDGVTRGSYSYVDADGKLQTAQYISDDTNGFRITATNLPKSPEPVSLPELTTPAPVADTPEVMQAKLDHEVALEKAKLESTEKETPLQLVQPAFYPAVSFAPQYHFQDGSGQYSYGYRNELSAKQETKTVDGVTRGSYSYVDADGKLQNAHYISDDTNGFRITATNLPKLPEPVSLPEFTTPAPVVDTPEVMQAKLDHAAALEKAKLESTEEETPANSVSGENLPKPVEDTPKVAKAKKEHFEAKKQAELFNPALNTIQFGAIPIENTLYVPRAHSVATIIPGGFFSSTRDWNALPYKAFLL